MHLTIWGSSSLEHLYNTSIYVFCAALSINTQVFFFTVGALSYKAGIKSNIIYSKFTDNKKLSRTACTSSTKPTFFSLYFYIKVDNNSFTYGSKSFLNPLAIGPQTFNAAYDTAGLVSPISFLIVLISPR